MYIYIYTHVLNTIRHAQKAARLKALPIFYDHATTITTTTTTATTTTTTTDNNNNNNNATTTTTTTNINASRRFQFYDHALEMILSSEVA